MFQNIHEKLYPIMTLFLVTLIICGVLVASQFPAFIESRMASLGASILVTGALSTATLLLAGHHAPLPLFAILLALHTMMPISRVISLVVAAIITAAHLALSFAHRFGNDNPFYKQVIFFSV